MGGGVAYWPYSLVDCDVSLGRGVFREGGGGAYK